MSKKKIKPDDEDSYDETDNEVEVVDETDSLFDPYPSDEDDEDEELSIDEGGAHGDPEDEEGYESEEDEIECEIESEEDEIFSEEIEIGEEE